MNMQRQEKNKQQDRGTDDAAEFEQVRVQRKEHTKNLAQRIYRCQRTIGYSDGRSL
jgi:hypothetical protein